MTPKSSGHICQRWHKTFVLPLYLDLKPGKYQELSAQENIGLGNINSLDHMEAIKEAAVESGAHDYIRTFESFYKTVLRHRGDDYEHDVDRLNYGALAD